MIDVDALSEPTPDVGGKRKRGSDAGEDGGEADGSETADPSAPNHPAKKQQTAPAPESSTQAV